MDQTNLNAQKWYFYLCKENNTRSDGEAVYAAKPAKTESQEP